MSTQTTNVSSAHTLVSAVVEKTKNRWLAESIALLAGVMLVSVLAQVTVRLPWTPVPITGQTFGVALMALLWGRGRAAGVMLSYLFLGGIGAPVFAGGAAYLSLGASSGYLLGMLVSSLVVGELADRGFTSSWGRAFLAASFGSVFVFGFGLLVLSFFVPREGLLVAGLLPFIPGDILKNSLAAWLAVRARRTV
jgi:biotin transport system substrate-specific component